MRPLKKRMPGSEPPDKIDLEKILFDKYDKQKDEQPFKPLEDNFSRKYIISIETMLLRVTREELKSQEAASIYPPLGIFYAPSNRKTKPRKRLPYLPKLLKD